VILTYELLWSFRSPNSYPLNLRIELVRLTDRNVDQRCEGSAPWVMIGPASALAIA
jgi:hypothetical protein